MMFITKKALPRRTFLRGVGATLALPLLDAMVPALSGAARRTTPRLGFIYVANGVIQDQWTRRPRAGLRAVADPEAARAGAEITSTCSAASRICRPTRSATAPAIIRASSAVWLTGVHAYDRSRPDVEVRLATSADQIAAREIGKTTQVPSIELNVDPPTQGACDTGDCFFNNTISWRNPTTPNPAEVASAHRVRAPVRRRRQRRAAAGADEAQRQHPRFGDAGSQRPRQDAGRWRPAQADRVPGIGARNRAAHPERRKRGASRRSSCPTVPPTFPPNSTSTSSSCTTCRRWVSGRRDSRLHA